MDNQAKLQTIIAENGYTQLQVTQILEERTGRPCSLRAVQAWLANPDFSAAGGAVGGGVGGVGGAISGARSGGMSGAASGAVRGGAQGVSNGSGHGKYMRDLSKSAKKLD